MSADREICFVIMPFSKTTEEHTEEYWTSHFESFLKPLIEENPSLEARRSKPLRGDVLREIITALVVSPIVVVDLTDRNPNVYWELGVRQSFKHCTVTIAEDGTELPFDLSVKGTLFYCPKDHLKNAKFCRAFKEAISDCLTHPDRPDSQVLETISGRGTLFEIFRRDEAIRRLDALLAEIVFNEAYFDHVVETTKKNIKDPSNRVFPTDRFRSSATELLITNRYVDESRDFFESAQEYCGWIVAINGQLSIWESSPSSVEKYLLKVLNQELKQFLQSFREEVTAAREKLSRRF